MARVLDLIRAIGLGVAGALCVASPVQADPALGGSVEATVAGKRVVFGLLKTDVVANVDGDLARVRVTQTFANPTSEAVHARYLFPLNKDAAVHRMTMWVGDEIVHARIEEVEQAERTFQQAKSQGKAAALLRQARPNMFTQRIANLMPGVPIRVAIEYVHAVPRVDGAYELVVPLVVGPRFQPPGSGDRLQDEPVIVPAIAQSEVGGGWEVDALPRYPDVLGLTVPDSIDPARVSLAVDLRAGVEIGAVASDSHRLKVTTPEPGRREVRLAGGRSIDNRDFVLRYRLAGEQTEGGLLAHHDGRGGFFSLMIEPPDAPDESQVLPRELVFLLDCSGSMNGLPMQASKAFMREALATLKSSDSFRIIRFSDSATEFSANPVPATAHNVRRGMRYTDNLHGSGGTMMTSGIRQALTGVAPPEALRIVVFLTDGYIGNELEVLSLVERDLGESRLYAFGVGTGVNRYLLSELGRVGRGFTRYMDPTEDVADVARRLSQRLEQPLLTDIEIDWGELGVEGVTPALIPDLFAGDSVRVMGRYDRPGDYQVTIKGRLRDRQARLPVNVRLPSPVDSQGSSAQPSQQPSQEPSHETRSPIPTTWARMAVADAMHLRSTPASRRPAGMNDDTIQSLVTQLGLDFDLVTRWTAFVAVSERVYNGSPETAASHDVPLPMVKGVAPTAYPSAPAAFGGYAAPEPGMWGSLAIVTGLLGWLGRRRRAVARASR